MKKRTIILLLSLSLPIIPNCTNFDGLNYGTIVTGVKFATKTFSIKAIPANTSVIEVEVSGTGLNSSMKFNLTKDAPTKALQKVPVGSKLITAVAKDSDGNVLARGESTVIIEGGKGNRVEVELRAVSSSSSSVNLNREENKPAENPTNTDTNSDDSDSTDSDSEDSDSNPSDSMPINDNSNDDNTDSEDDSDSEDSDSDSISDSSGVGGSSNSSTFLEGEEGEYVDIDIQTTDGSPLPSGMSIRTPTPSQSSIQTAL